MLNSHSHTRPKKSKRTKIKKEKSEPPKPEHTMLETKIIDPTIEKDLTHYISDRVELMRQVYSVLKDRELLAMTPSCFRGLKIDDLQELCLEEVLGISSKRLRSVIDGYDCPSDTDSSTSSVALEIISLDSISSDEEVLDSSHRKKKHNKKKKAEVPAPSPKEKKKSQAEVSGGAGMTVLELLELQARARAIRAQLAAVQPHKNISAQYQDDEDDEENADGTNPQLFSDSADEVQIKEEPPDVVQIDSSSDSDNNDRKPKVSKSKKSNTPKPSQSNATSSKIISKTLNPEPSTSNQESAFQNVTVQPPPRKIKLNRNNVFVSVSNTTKDSSKEAEKNSRSVIIDLDISENIPTAKDDGSGKLEENKINRVQIISDVVLKKADKEIANSKVKAKKDKKKKSVKKKKNGSDNDELMLELSDSEKMDLLESFDTSDSDADSESDEDDDQGDNKKTKEVEILEIKDVVVEPETEPTEAVEEHGEKSPKNAIDTEPVIQNDSNIEEIRVIETVDEEIDNNTIEENMINNKEKEDDVDEDRNNGNQAAINFDTEPISEVEINPEHVNKNSDCIQKEDMIEDIRSSGEEETTKDSKKKEKSKKSKDTKRPSKESTPEDKTDSEEATEEIHAVSKKKLQSDPNDLENSEKVIDNDHLVLDSNTEGLTGKIDVHSSSEKKDEDQELSEGECSYSSDGIEITENKPDVVCISDDSDDEAGKRKYRKRKKSSDHEEEQDIPKADDENFFKISEDDVIKTCKIAGNNKQLPKKPPLKIQDKCIEIEKNPNEEVLKIIDKDALDTVNSEQEEIDVFEISDESSSDEMGLSKEPTTEEIVELSKKIDTEMVREAIVLEKNISGDVDASMREEMERFKKNECQSEESGVSWKERWLESDKVKKVLATSNLCNALRKKNKEMKKKLADEQKVEEEQKIAEAKEREEEKKREEMENQKAAVSEEAPINEGSVDQYKTLTGSTKYVCPVEEIKEDQQKKLSMAKDAKQLLKMYKKLLKVHEKRDEESEEKKKERKEKKKKKKEKKEKKKKKNDLEKSDVEKKSQELVESALKPAETG